MRIAADLHIHSTLSPCASLEMSPRAIVDRAMELGLDLIAVTDHNGVENALHAWAYGRSHGLRVICGMEAQTSEDVHILCLMPDPAAADALYERVYPLLPDVPNRPDFFGDQVVVDCEDEIVRVEPRLLLNSLDMSIAALADLVRSLGGVVVPAHVESAHSSLLANLGFVPPELSGCPLEISYNASEEDTLARFPALAGCRLVSGSDAHYLADVGRAFTVYESRDPSISSLYEAARSGRYRIERKAV